MATLSGLNGALYIGGTRWAYSTTLSLSIERDVAEVQIQQQQYIDQAVGPYKAEFSGTGVVDSTDKTLFDNVTGGSSTTVAIYPTNDSTDYWSFTGYFTSYSVAIPSDGFNVIDFAGIVDGALTITGFS
jgi:hypothetical protein